MFRAIRPTAARIERFIAESRGLPLSYGTPGLLQSCAAGAVDTATVVVGRGRADFERARAALIAWGQFDVGWVELHPHRAPVAPGTVVAVLIRHLGFWSMNGCRVVYHTDHDDHSFGYAYGTLSNHAESGEELFEVRLDPHTGDVVYRICATARPQAKLAWLGVPFVRVLQARFRRDSAAAMRRAATSSAMR